MKIVQSITYTKMQSIFCANCTKKIIIQSISHVKHSLAKHYETANITNFSGKKAIKTSARSEGSLRKALIL
jgi:hypothetical protein